MGKEIERKFLVTGDGWRKDADAGVPFRQGYLAGPLPASVRVRVEGDRANINIKSGKLGIVRTEFEYPIPLADAREMLASLCQGPLIEKTRFHVPHGGYTWEVDVFEGDNEGLVVAEVELQSEDAEPPLPGWVGREVSNEPRYYNVRLVEHPYRDWGADER